jgi:hypothetical protein
MRKKVLLAVAASLVLGGVAMTTPLQPAQAKAQATTGVTCREAAKMQYPADRKERRAYKKACKAHYKSLTKGNRHGLLRQRQAA